VKVLVGLGNPGERYAGTRHNVGYLVAEEVIRRAGRPRQETRAGALVCRVTIGGNEVLVARPLGFMNRSGPAVVALLDAAGAAPEDLLVVCDDLYLDFGTIRIRARGSHGGHNGLLSILEALGTRELPRVRVGVGPADPRASHADFVLEPFTRAEQESLPAIVDRAADGAGVAIEEGIAAAMNRFNGRLRTPAAPGGSV